MKGLFEKMNAKKFLGTASFGGLEDKLLAKEILPLVNNNASLNEDQQHQLIKYISALNLELPHTTNMERRMAILQIALLINSCNDKNCEE